MRMRSNPSSLYIHIPFCKQICSYCDFAKVIYNQKRIEAYFKSLFFELEPLKKNRYKTIYIGGGTPSCIDLTILETLLQQLYPLLDEDYEFSIECNIEDINEKFLSLLVQYKVNRLSCGVQTFQDDLIKLCNRHHHKEMVFQNLTLASQYIKNISIDMIYAFPNQSMEQLKEDVKLALSLPIQHLSYYSLLIEDNTILKARHYENASDEIQANFYTYIYQTLQDHGFTRYEFSNFSKKGYESKHNLTYWHNEHYDAIGLNASGYEKNMRYTNTKNIEKYIRGQYDKEILFLFKEDIQFEEIMLRLRLDEGLSIPAFNKKFHTDFLKIYQNETQFLIENDFLIIQDNILKTTFKGSLLLNDILVYFLP